MLLLLLMSFLSFSCHQSDNLSTSSQRAQDDCLRTNSTVNTSYLSLKKLQLSAPTVWNSWVEKDLFFDDQSASSGTASAVDERSGVLMLVTNRHVLGLDALAKADNGAAPEIQDYDLYVIFNHEKRIKVDAFMVHPKQDIALLFIKSTDLIDGDDYILIQPATQPVKIGDDVVVVGTPLGISGTYTFGKISAIRNDFFHNGGRVFQTDAAINHGNSGRPLFLKRNNNYYWIGINTAMYHDANNLGFSIDSTEIIKEDVWKDMSLFPATPQGAADFILKYLNIKANLVVDDKESTTADDKDKNEE
jgi:S1-C subfamily serine protease